MDCLSRERIKDFSLLTKLAYQISKSLAFSLGMILVTIGRGDWQVIFLHGKVFAKKFACSGKYNIILKRGDGLILFIWLNKIVLLYLS